MTGQQLGIVPLTHLHVHANGISLSLSIEKNPLRKHQLSTTLSMQDKMAAGAFGHARNYG